MEFLQSERVRFAFLSGFGGVCLYMEELKFFIFYTVMALLFIYGEVVKLNKKMDKCERENNDDSLGS